jgi:hypothetical protein
MSQLMIDFEGSGSGVEELTWAQRDVWDLMRRTGRTMNIGGTVAAAPGDTVEHIARLLRFIVSRHQALRTRLRHVEGGVPQQVVSASGEVPLEIVDADATADPDAVAEELRVRYQTTMFDPFNEWPVRMGVVRQGGILTHVVVMYYHVVVDGFGIEAVVRDLVHLDPVTGHQTGPVRGTQPLELARLQRAPEALAQSAKSLRYWERQLRRVPPGGFVDGSDARSPRFWEIVCESPALLLAVRMISARAGVGAGAVLLAAYATALVGLTGVNPTVVQLVVSNRFRPGFADAVGNLRQFGLGVVDVAGGTFDDVVARSWTAAIGAYKHGYYDPVAHGELLARLGRERGETIDVSCYLNDRRSQTRDEEAGPVPTAEDLRSALPLTTVHWGVREDTYDGWCYLHVEDIPDAIGFTMWGDTHRFPPARIERCAREIEAVVVRAALEPAAVVGAVGLS